MQLPISFLLSISFDEENARLTRKRKYSGIRGEGREERHKLIGTTKVTRITCTLQRALLLQMILPAATTCPFFVNNKCNPCNSFLLIRY